MMIASDLPSPTLLKSATPPSASERGESAAVPDRDGDSDDATPRLSLRAYQGTKVNTTA